MPCSFARALVLRARRWKGGVGPSASVAARRGGSTAAGMASSNQVVEYGFEPRVELAKTRISMRRLFARVHQSDSPSSSTITHSSLSAHDFGLPTAPLKGEGRDDGVVRFH